MSLPSPNASFRLPSLYDDLELDCRLYFPYAKLENEDGRLWLKGCAIFAHPYAPLGGCYDDPVVHSVGSILLKNGFVLATFNFRGAERSSGKTSWSGKAELSDYVSLYVLILSFLNASGVLSYMTTSQDIPPLLLLGGYSYGSMIASHLPDIKVPLDILQNASAGSTEHEIENRAHELAQAFLGHYESQQQRGRSSLKASEASPTKGATFGGYESPIAARRISRENSRRSIDPERVRQSVDRVRERLHRAHGSQDGEEHSTSEGHKAERLQVVPAIAYLLISPLLGPVSSFATMFSGLKFERKTRNAYLARNAHASDPSESLSRHPSFIVFGTDDHFTSSRKVRDWCETTKSTPGSQLQYREVPKAGHFWHDQSLDSQLRSAVSQWLMTVG